MSWYVHPSKQLRDDELPPELVVTNRDGSVEQVYVPYNASDQLEAENAKLRELVRDMCKAFIHGPVVEELECDETYVYDWEERFEFAANFCPSCGARVVSDGE